MLQIYYCLIADEDSSISAAPLPRQDKKLPFSLTFGVGE